MKNWPALFLLICLSTCHGSVKNVPDDFELGIAQNGIYSNQYFGFEIKYDTSWKVHSRETLQNVSDLSREYLDKRDQNLKSVFDAAEVKTARLFGLSQFEFGSIQGLNPSLMITVENVQNSTKIKTEKDYLKAARQTMIDAQMDFRISQEVHEKHIGNLDCYAVEMTIDYPFKGITQEYYISLKRGFALGFIITYINQEQKEELHKMIESINVQN